MTNSPDTGGDSHAIDRPERSYEVRPKNPREAWDRLMRGNRRFVAGDRLHPNQDAHRRQDIAAAQAPFATIFSCADSRVASEIIFDQGLGDLFVVRTAGHVLDPCVIGSIEFGVEAVGSPLVVVMGHESCGAVKAAVEAADTGAFPPGYIRDVVEKVMPSVVQAQRQGPDGGAHPGDWHVRRTVRMLAERSTILEHALDQDRVAIVGVNYGLTDGRIRLVDYLGDITGSAGARRAVDAAP